MRGEELKLCCLIICCAASVRPAPSSEAIVLFSKRLSHMGRLSQGRSGVRELTMVLLLGLRDRTL